MRTLRSPHNVELKTPEAKFCLDFDLADAPVYIPATSFVRINAYACVGGKRASSSPGNPDGASTSRRQVSRYDDYARPLSRVRFSARDFPLREFRGRTYAIRSRGFLAASTECRSSTLEVK